MKFGFYYVKIFLLFILFFLSACTSSNLVVSSVPLCTFPSSNAGCAEQCAGYNSENRPLWCYRLFCDADSDIYGSWCDGSDTNKYVILPGKDTVITDPLVKALFGITGTTNGGAGSSSNVSATSSLIDNGYGYLHNATMADGSPINGSGGYINVIGSSVSATAGISDSNLVRFAINYDSTAIDINNPNGKLQLQDLNNPPSAAGTLTENNLYDIYTVNGVDYYSRGSTSSVGILLGTSGIHGLASGAKVNSISSLDGWIQNGLGKTDALANDNQTIYLKLIAAITQDQDGTSSASRFTGNYGVSMLDFEGIRSGSQLAEAFSVLKKNGEDYLPIIPNAYVNGIIKNGTWSEGIQTATEANSENHVKDWHLDGLARAIHGVLSGNPTAPNDLRETYVVSSGHSSVYDPTIKGLLYDGDHSRTVHTRDLFQTNGDVRSWQENKAVGTDEWYTPTMSFGNADESGTAADGTSYLDKQSSFGTVCLNADCSDVAHSAISMSYTSSYPTAFLYHLWRMDGYSSSVSGSDLVHSGIAEADIKDQLSSSYVKTASYNYMIAGALDTTVVNGSFASDVGYSLAAYTNAAGMLKYNYVTIAVNDYQNVVLNSNASSGMVTVSNENNYTTGSKKDSATGAASTNASAASNSITDAQKASSMLTGYISQLNQVFSKVMSPNDINFAIRHSATSIYGGNSFLNITNNDGNLILDENGNPVKAIQASFYFTKAIDANEEKNLSYINSKHDRDTYVFTGVTSEEEYDHMSDAGKDSYDSDDIIVDIQGSSFNGSFWALHKDADLTYDAATGIATIKDNAGNVLEKYKADALADATDIYYDHVSAIGNKDGTSIDSTKGETNNNSFMALDKDKAIDTKFNWQADQKTYYEIDVIGCKDGVNCNANAYQDLKDANSSLAGYEVKEDVRLERFNEHSNVLMLAMQDDNSVMTSQGVKFSYAVFTLSPDVVAGTLSTYFDATKLVDSNGSNYVLSDACSLSNDCSYTDLLALFTYNPNIFANVPSNIYGYGNVDLQETVDNLNYQMNYFYGNPDNYLSKKIQEFFYNQGCADSNCGVALGGDLYFNYVPDAYYDPTSAGFVDDEGNRIIMTDAENGTVAVRSAALVAPFSSGTEAGDSKSDTVIFSDTPSGVAEISSRDINSAWSYADSTMGMTMAYALGAAGTANGFNNMLAFDTGATSGGRFSFRAPVIGSSAFVGGRVVQRDDMNNYALTPAEKNSDHLGFGIEMANMTATSQMLSGVRYNQDFGKFGSVSVMYFGNKNDLDLINRNRIASLVSHNSSYLLLSNQQGMFGNPYLRMAGGFLGSAYSASASMFDDKLDFRITNIQSSNPMFNMFSYNNLSNGSQGIGDQLGLNNAGNMMQELQIAHRSADNKSMYSFSYGLLNERGTVLGSYGLVDPSVDVQTNYFDLKVVQNLFKDTYFLVNYNIGVVSDAFSGFLTGGNAMVAQKLSLGLVQDNIFNGSLFFVYTEPNRLLSGTVNVNGLDNAGNAITNGYIDFLHSVVERNYELGYTYKSDLYTIGFSTIIRTNPYRLNVDVDGLFLIRLNCLI